MIWRKITPRLESALSDSPAVLVNGARQTGKTTLTQGMGHYVSLDEAGALAAASEDPMSFLSQMTANQTGTLIIDEVQMVPQLFPAIKLLIDRDRRAGRFLLTGSSNVFLLPKMAESLAGRVEILTLMPFAQSEIRSGERNVLDDLLELEFPFSAYLDSEVLDRAQLIERVVAGGYPEVLSRSLPERRQAWFESYVTTILQRDVREIANIAGLTQMPRLLTLLAARCATTLNMADVARASNLPYTTLQRYMTLLETLFLTHLMPAWSANLGQRAVKSPKLLLNDTGLIVNLLRLDSVVLVEGHALFGPLVENFVLLEMMKLATWSRSRPGLYHWRTQSRQEVDLIIEGAAGFVVGVEVKASARIDSSDFKGLRALATATGEKFRRGVVFYNGSQALPFGLDMYALPISALWR